MAAITSPDYPDERLIVCRNPDLARERRRKREALLAATDLSRPLADRQADPRGLRHRRRSADHRG